MSAGVIIQQQLRVAAGIEGAVLPLLSMCAGDMPVHAVIDAALMLGLDPVMLFQSCEGISDNLAGEYAQSA